MDIEKFRESLKQATTEFMATFTPEQAAKQKEVEAAYREYKAAINREDFESWNEKYAVTAPLWEKYFVLTQEFKQLRIDAGQDY